MPDKIFARWLAENEREMRAFCRESELVTIAETYGDPPDRYILDFHCRGLIRSQTGVVQEAHCFTVGFCFHRDYLKHVIPVRLLTWLSPLEIFHPNIRVPMICLGPIDPGTSLLTLGYRLYDLIRYRNHALHDGLNPVACQWARNHMDRFPLDARPLKWKARV